MSKYLVERYLPGLTPEQLGAAASAAKATTASMTSEGTPVRYLRSTFIPGEDKCYCLFEGPSADVVKTANERAQLPYGGSWMRCTSPQRIWASAAVTLIAHRSHVRHRYDRNTYPSL